MSLNFNKLTDNLLFVPLGGAGEIGMNVNLYQYKGQWLMVDLGAGFAEDYLPGVDMIAPDISFIEERREQLAGLVLTHAHEDHLGTVQYLWNALRCPVYATPFTAAFLRAKLVESPFGREVKITEIQPGSKFNVGKFSLEYVGITHSIPEMNGVIIRTDAGTVLHTGDWKFDPNPLVGTTSDFAKLESLRQEGVLALVGDSTNVFREGVSGSEGDLRESLIKLIGSCDRMVAVTTFASNVARVETIAKAAQAAGRKVVLAGRSLRRIVDCAQEAGYLTDIPPFLDDREASRFPRDKLLILCTGCQGEPLAAATKLANGSHPHLRLNPGDTIIFSSKIIPGNDKRIFRLFNKFIHAGIEVMTEKDHFVHVSGHPSRDELKRMYELVKPQIAVPVHGELVHIHGHAMLAKECGVPQTVQVENGDVLSLAPGAPEKLGKVKCGELAIDGNYLLPVDSGVMRMRRKIQRDGVVVVTLVFDRGFTHLVTEPVIVAPGALDQKDDRDLLRFMREEVRDVVEDSVRKGKKGPREEHVMNIARSALRRILRSEVGKEPMIEVQVEVVE